MKEKLKKISAVIFLTLLIWFWAYMALELDIEESGTLNISPATSPDLYVRFNREVPVRLKLSMKGPASRVQEFRRKLFAKDDSAEKERLVFHFDAEKENMTTPGQHKLDVLQFLKEDERLKDLGLTVVKCDVATIEVIVEKLSIGDVTIQCLNENGDIIRHLSIEPARIQTYVPQDWTKEEYIANVTLTQLQIDQARKSPVIAKPYIELSASKKKYSDVSVAIKLPPTEEPLSDRILQPKIGYIWNRNMSEKFKVELINESELTDTMQFKASDSAWNEYKERTPNHILIEIRSIDETSQGEITRQVRYNFPPESLIKKEIRLNHEPRRAKFKLIPRSASQPVP